MLELAIARALYDRFPEASEGGWRRSARTSSRARAARWANGLDLGARLSETAADVPLDELDRIVKSRNVIAALLEAAIAALYLEHGFEQIEPAIVAAFAERIEYARTTHVDHKTELQEVLARTGRQVSYSGAGSGGAAARPYFSLRRADRRRGAGRGSGRSKKAAEQEAAEQALAARTRHRAE